MRRKDHFVQGDVYIMVPFPKNIRAMIQYKDAILPVKEISLWR